MKIDKEKLVLDNMRLVNFVLNKYINYSPELLEDLQQEGYMALCIAAERWDPSISKFSTYAVLYIKSYIMKYMRDNNPVHLSRDVWNAGKRPVMQSIYEELNENGLRVIDTLMDEYALDELNVNILEETILLEANHILSQYTETQRDICKEDLCSKMYSEPLTQQFLSDKYCLSQPTIARLLKKFYRELRKEIYK